LAPFPWAGLLRGFGGAGRPGWVWKRRSRVPNSRAKLGGGDGCVEHDYKDAADLAYHAVNAMCW